MVLNRSRARQIKSIKFKRARKIRLEERLVNDAFYKYFLRAVREGSQKRKKHWWRRT